MAPEVIAAEALALVEAGAPADRILKRTLRAHPELDNAGRKRVAELVHGVRCHRLRLEYLRERHPSLSWSELYDHRDTLVVDWPTDDLERLRIQASLPAFVAEAFLRQFGPEAFDVAACLNTPGPIAIRARDDLDALAARLSAEGRTVTPGRLAPSALRLEGRPDIRGSAAWREGAFEVQDEASQMVAVAVDARPGESVIDLCAGAGGKTLALASSMQDRGTLWACDVDAARLTDLEVRLRRAGVRCVRVVQLAEGPRPDRIDRTDGRAPDRVDRDRNDGPRPDRVDRADRADRADGARPRDPGLTPAPRARPDLALPAGADRVLVDAPCSAVGTWRRGPDRKWRITESEVAELALLQRTLLRRARALVRPGGRLVYATCSLLAAENEDVAAAFLAEGGVTPVPVWAGAPASVTLRPDTHDTDGFFIAAFERT